MKAKLAFYKGEGNIVDKTIKWYTNSIYSHVELIDSEGYWYSTSPRELKLNKRKVDPTKGNWDYLDVEIDKDRLDTLFKRYEGCGYDWTGIILSQVLPFNIENPNKLFCSEWCAMVIGIDNANTYSPGELNKFIASTT